MKRILLTTLTIATFGIANAQLTNAGLNTWASGDPTGWTAPINAATGGASVSEITTGAPEGSSAASVKVVSCPACPILTGGAIPDPMTGILGQQAFYTSRPTTFSFKWKGNVAVGDTSLIAAQFTDAGTVIGEARFDVMPGTMQATWLTQNVTVSYAGSTSPDSVIIAVLGDRWPLTGGANTSSTSTYVDVDDFQFTGGSTGIDMMDANNDLIFAYPNPANDVVNFNLLGTDASVMEIVDIAGKVVYTEANMALKTRVDVSGFNNGAYFVRFLNAKKEYIGTARFNVAR